MLKYATFYPGSPQKSPQVSPRSHGIASTFDLFDRGAIPGRRGSLEHPWAATNPLVRGVRTPFRYSPAIAIATPTVPAVNRVVISVSAVIRPKC